MGLERKGTWIWLGRIKEPRLRLLIFTSLYSGQGIEQAEPISLFPLNQLEAKMFTTKFIYVTLGTLAVWALGAGLKQSRAARE